jgi:hypothetical protein
MTAQSRMVTDLEIMLIAQELMRNHGSKAAMECAQMADRWKQRGDESAAHVWHRVMLAIRELEMQQVQ